MKHVFVINSHTTFLTALGTVNYLKLKDEDVILIYTRNYANKVTPVPYKIVEGTEIANSCRNIATNYEKVIKDVDEFIDKSICTRYDLYVPHMWHFFFQLLYTNRKCNRVSYIQEGGPVQTKVYENDVPLLERIKTFIRHTVLGRRTFECKWYKKGIIYKQFSLDSYAINHAYFKCLPSKNHIVKWPEQKLDLTIDTHSPIFIFDGHINNGLVEADVYLKVCRDIVSQYGKNKNYVKFHPAESKEERNIIMNYFLENGITAELMSDDIPMEYVIIQFRNLTFVGFTSSLLYYAHDYGHNVICCEKTLTQASDFYREHVKSSGFQTYSETYNEF